MRFAGSAARLCLPAVIALVMASCGSTQSAQPRDSSSAGVDVIEDSGKRLSGEFVLGSVEDAYRVNKAQTPPDAVFTFDESGGFKRQDKSRTEQGAYLIGNGGEMIIYIEKINGEQIADARIERYLISDQSEEQFTLSSSSKKLLLRKR